MATAIVSTFLIVFFNILIIFVIMGLISNSINTITLQNIAILQFNSFRWAEAGEAAGLFPLIENNPVEIFGVRVIIVIAVISVLIEYWIIKRLFLE